MNLHLSYISRNNLTTLGGDSEDHEGELEGVKALRGVGKFELHHLHHYPPLDFLPLQVKMEFDMTHSISMQFARQKSYHD